MTFPKLFVSTLLTAAAASIAAQAVTGAGGSVPLGMVTGTGPSPVYVDQSHIVSPPNAYTVSVAVAGTAPTACTWVFETSNDMVHWFATTPPMTCTASWGFQSTYTGGFLFGRVNVLTFTGITGVSFTYTRGR